LARTRFVRNRASSRTAAIERGLSASIRSSPDIAGTLWPNVPPAGPGVDVWPRMVSSALERTRIAPYPLDRPKSFPRTSSKATAWPAPMLTVRSAPFWPSTSWPRNLSVTEASAFVRFATVTSVV
jgi:hypothetical protein